MRIPTLKRTRPNVRKRAAAAGGLVLAAGGAALALSRGTRALIDGKGRAAANAVKPSPEREYDDVTLARAADAPGPGT